MGMHFRFGLDHNKGRGDKLAMEVHSIEALLAARGAWLKGDTGDQEEAVARKSLTTLIADNYRVFEEVRDRIFRATESFMRYVEIIPETLPEMGHALVEEMLRHSVVVKEVHGHEICEVAGRRYLSGGWLEELAFLAAIDAGADEAFYGQVIGWKVKGFTGETIWPIISANPVNGWPCW
jgi:hypothetical protein